jgi:enamine deaminase RidA (YjgF/YER057c/UK114 family)
MTNDSNTLAKIFAGVAVGAGLGFLLSRRSTASSVIERWGVTPRAAAAVRHSDVVYLSGQVGDLDPAVLEASDVSAQTEQTLAKIDTLLAQCGTSKRNIIRYIFAVWDRWRSLRARAGALITTHVCC